MVIDYKKKYLKYKNKYIQFKGGACPEEEDEPIKLSDIPYDKDHTPKLKYIIAKIKTIIETINTVIPSSYHQRSSNETVELFLYWILHYKEVIPDHNFFDVIETKSYKDVQMPWNDWPINENDLFNKWLLEHIRKNEKMEEKIRTHASSVEELDLCAIVDVSDQLNIKAQELWWNRAGFFLLHEEGSEEVQALDESDDDEENEEEDEEEGLDEEYEEYEEVQALDESDDDEENDEENDEEPIIINKVEIPYHSIHTETLNLVIKELKSYFRSNLLEVDEETIEKKVYKFLQWYLHWLGNGTMENNSYGKVFEHIMFLLNFLYDWSIDYLETTGFTPWLKDKIHRNEKIMIEIGDDLYYEDLFNDVDSFLEEDIELNMSDFPITFFYYWFSIYRYAESYENNKPKSNRVKECVRYLKMIKEHYVKTDKDETKLTNWIKEHFPIKQKITNIREDEVEVEPWAEYTWHTFAIAWLNENDSCD